MRTPSPSACARTGGKAAAPGAVLAVGSFGPENFAEFSKFGHSPISYDTFDEFCAQISGAGFKVVFSQNDVFRFLFKTPRDVLRHVRDTGVNGASASVQNVPVEVSAYDRLNSNEYAGLINREYFDAYKQTYAELLERLDASSPLKALFAADADWDSVIGSTVNQPLLIVNTVREVAENTSGIYNYGYIGSDASATADSYTAVSVRVKVSEGAVATVYLVDTADKQPLSYSTPAYTFWYDNDGNVLKGEPAEDASREEQRENIAYTLQENGLYTDEDGNYYANLYNYGREYYDERASYYDGEGNRVSFDNLVEAHAVCSPLPCDEWRRQSVQLRFRH